MEILACPSKIVSMFMGPGEWHTFHCHIKLVAIERAHAHACHAATIHGHNY